MTNETLIDDLVGICKEYIEKKQTDPYQLIPCLMGCLGVLTLDYNLDVNKLEIEIEKVLSELEIKLKDHPNFHLLDNKTANI